MAGKQPASRSSRSNASRANGKQATPPGPAAADQRTASERAGERISYYPIAAEDQLSEYQRNLFAKVEERTGLVPNVFRAYAWRPERFAKWFAHFSDLMRGTETLTATDREMISVAVSMANGCLYCLVAHGAMVRQLTGDPVLGDRITLDYRRAGLDERRTAMLDYAVKITKTPLECDEADIERLRLLGFTHEDIWDIAEIAAMYNFTNRLAMATGMMPNPEYHGMAR
ncbi:MAG TPA: peroxidase-related enzyme [Dehalococcoidia bacterium]|nr:peroxidase-related enzyme [Dehalococcoidia bacterium]